MIQEAEEQVRIIRKNLKTAQSRQKSQYDRSHKEVAYGFLQSPSELLLVLGTEEFAVLV